MKIGIIGYGEWAKKVCKKIPKDLIASTLVRSAEHVPKYLNPTVESEDFFRSNLSHVLILSPIPTQIEYARECMDRGINTYVEKPFYLNEKQFQNLSELKNTWQSFLYVNHLNFYSMKAKVLREKLRNDKSITRLEFFWSKSSSSNQPLELNLLTHDLVTLFVVSESFENLNSVKHYSDSTSMRTQFLVDDLSVEIDYSINGYSNSQRPQRHVRIISEDGHCELLDLQEDNDKLAISLNHFFFPNEIGKSSNWYVHKQVNMAMQKIIDRT